MYSFPTGIGIFCAPSTFLTCNHNSLPTDLFLATFLHKFVDKMIEIYSEHETNFIYFPIFDEMAHGISINVLLPPKSKQGYLLNAKIVSMTVPKLNEFHFLSSINVEQSNENVGPAKKMRLSFKVIPTSSQCQDNIDNCRLNTQTFQETV